MIALSLLSLAMAQPETAPPAQRSATRGPTVLVDIEWRGMALGGHASHGPGFGIAFGVLDDHLRFGLHGFARPGPWNPQTFTITPDQPYKGAETLELRSDGGVLGPSITVGTDLGEAFRIDVGAMVGYGGFGFYLVGDDRKTPDGRLPSAWENELMDGRDSSLGIGVDVGPRLTWAASEHLRPYVAVRYTSILGYDAFVRSDYSGMSVAFGVTVGRFR